MKVPGIGEVDKKTAYIGGAMVLGVGGVIWWRRKKAASQAAASSATGDTSSADSQDAIDPTTGLPYSQESGVYGFGGIDPSTGVPYMYENSTGTTTNTSGNQFTTNAAWLSQAEQDAQELFGATYALATSAFGKYLAQSTAGLSDNEYQLVSEVVAELGQPPVGGPYRLIHAPVTGGGGDGGGGSGGGAGGSSGGSGGSGSGSGSGGSSGGSTQNHVSVTVVRFGNPAPWNSTMWGIAQHYGYGSAGTNYLPIWNDPMNSALKTNRGTPERIQPGDTVWVIPR